MVAMGCYFFLVGNMPEMIWNQQTIHAKKVTCSGVLALRQVQWVPFGS